MINSAEKNEEKKRISSFETTGHEQLVLALGRVGGHIVYRLQMGITLAFE